MYTQQAGGCWQAAVHWGAQQWRAEPHGGVKGLGGGTLYLKWTLVLCVLATICSVLLFPGQVCMTTLGLWALPGSINPQVRAETWTLLARHHSPWALG